MSTRQIRKWRALKEREAKLERGDAHDEPGDEDGESDDDEPVHTQKPSAFALLAGADGGSDDEDANDDSDAPLPTAEDAPADSEDAPTTKKAQPSRKKKKKKKKRASAQPVQDTHSADMDDIDKALKSLGQAKSARAPADSSPAVGPEDSGYYHALAVSTHHLQVGNEMRRIFGKAVDEAERQIEAENREQRRQTQQDSVGLTDAVSGRMSVSGPGLPSLLRRRNLFIQGKEEWPKATGGGLGMNAVEKRADGVVEFAFVHNSIYQSTQREFGVCVQSMDPRLMINMVRFNPYHIATLLQVAEIAKQERDHSVAGELLERALFSFGRASSSAFATAIAQGKARLDFRRPENREFYLASWRYIDNVSMRATWRTALEWARLLFALNPDEDPYEMKLVIDIFAVRSMQLQLFQDMTERGLFGSKAQQRPNIRFSAALAAKLLAEQNKTDPKKAMSELQDAIRTHPWVAARLCQALDISKTPPAIWGREPPDDRQALYSELYATQAVDLWKTNSDFLLSAAQSLSADDTSTSAVTSSPETSISRSEARHLILTDKPALLSLIPRDLTAQLDNTADPLPPPDNLPTYDAAAGSATPHGASSAAHAHSDPLALVRASPTLFIEEISELHRIFELLIPNFTARLERQPGAGPGADRPADEALALGDADVTRAVQQSNMPPQMLVRLLERLVRFREVLADERGQRVEDGRGAFAVMEGGSRLVIGGPMLEGGSEDGDGEEYDTAPGEMSDEDEE